MSQLPFSKYDAEFRKDHPETIGETDQTFDLSNYCEWLEKRVADRDALRAKLERTKEELAQARRSSLRRMSGRAYEDAMFIRQDASSEFYLNATRHADRLMRFFNACRFELGE